MAEEIKKEATEPADKKAEKKVAPETASGTKADAAKTAKTETSEAVTVSAEEYEKLNRLASECKDKWYRTAAEYENYRRRTTAQLSARFAEGKADILVKLLPVKDNLERALDMADEGKTKDGIRMVLKSFEKVLEAENVTEINPRGEAFDPNVANAVMAVAAEEGDTPGTVKQVLQKGYRLGDKIVRFAQVAVVSEE